MALKHLDVIEAAGDYVLKGVILHNHEGEGVKVEDEGTNIAPLILEFNIFESLYKNSVVGTAVVLDTQNVIGNLPIQGTERISFKLSTPGAHGSASIDCSVKTGHPMYVYAITDRTQRTGSAVSYVIHFSTREFLRNVRTKVSKAYSGRMDEMVYSIFKDEASLDSRKDFDFQKTRNQDKIVVPNLKPFDAIGMISKRSLADNSKSNGFLFYETTKGFQFRSWESLCVDTNGEPRPPKQIFEYRPANIGKKGPSGKDASDFERDALLDSYEEVEQYKFLNSTHDTAVNQALGTYAQRVITHNIYDKSYKISDYNYHTSFDETSHTDEGPTNYAVVKTPVDYDNKALSDYPEAKISVMPTTRFAHGEDTGTFGVDVEQDGVIEGKRDSKKNEIVAGSTLELTIKGQSFLSAGDVIEFNLPNLDANDPKKKPDPFFAGRYIISNLHHRVTDKDYIQVLECVKDAISNPYHPSTVKNYTNIAGRQPSTKSPRDIVNIKDY
tara:strand:+ start:113 stop:1603 length:1491 start_codon:yes stop_codon:yes gene_type:complete